MLALRPTHIGMLTLTLLLAACGDGKVAKLPEPEISVAVPQTQADVVNEPSEVAIKKSGGLGLDMTALAMLHGEIKKCVTSRDGRESKPCFADNKKASLTDISENKYATGFVVRESLDTLDNTADAHPYVRKYIPADSRLLQTVSYSFPDSDLNKIYNNPVESYYSPWLAARLTVEEWQKYGSPGQFYVSYVNREASIHLGTYSRN